MSTRDPDPFGTEREPATRTVEELERDLEVIREQAEPLLERLSEDLQMTRDDVRRLAIVTLSRYLTLTQRDDTFILVVQGTARPYDNALQVLVSEHGELDALISHVTSRAEGGPE